MPLCQVRCVCGNFVGDNPSLNIIFIRQAQVLFGRDVTQHGAAIPAYLRGANAGSDVVVARRDICR